MARFRLGLKSFDIEQVCGVDPEWHIESIQEVEARNIKEAKARWARRTGYDLSRHWDGDNQTYWGWPVVEVTTRGKEKQEIGK